MMSRFQHTLKYFPPIEATVKENESPRDLTANPLRNRIAVILMGLRTHQFHLNGKQNRLCRSGAKQPQCAKLMTKVKLRLIGITFSVAMISEKVESELLISGLYRSGVVVDVHPAIKLLL